MTETVYDFIRAYFEAHAMSPSVREIGAACYINVATVIRYLDKLEAQGRIKRLPMKARTIRLIEPEQQK
jgi:SOS-response transcriptional repressor LexA